MLATPLPAARLPLLLGAALRPLPLAPLQPVLALLLLASAIVVVILIRRIGAKLLRAIA